MITKTDSVKLIARASIDAFTLLHIVDEKAIKGMVDAQLAREIANEVLSMGVRTETLTHGESALTVEFVVYVASPGAFQDAVRLEASRLYEKAMRR